jgi:hypothetical protein
MSFGVGTQRKQWSSEDEALAKELMAQGASEVLFLEKLGRSKAAAHTHFYYKAGKRPYRVRVRPSLAPVGGTDVHVSARPTDELLEDAKRRALAPRDITAQLMGDPPRGYSALDKQNVTSHSA